MTTNKELARATHPSKKPSFSPNLHRFLKKWAKTSPSQCSPEVWTDSEGTKWIGHMDPIAAPGQLSGFIGVRLMRVLCDGAVAYHHRGWWSSLGPGNMTHVTDFWDRYLQIGRCAIDTVHRQSYIGDEGRYILTGKIRTCTWCGAQHKLRIEKKVTTRLIEHYDPITPKEAA